MVNKQAKMERKAKVVVIEQPYVLKHAHQINEYQQESKSAEKC